MLLNLVCPFLLHILSRFCGKNQKSERPEDEARTRLSISAWQLPLMCCSPAIFGVNSNSFYGEWRTPTFIKCGEKPGHCRQCVLLLFLCALPNWKQQTPFANLISGQCTKFQCLINWALSFLAFQATSSQHVYYCEYVCGQNRSKHTIKMSSIPQVYALTLLTLHLTGHRTFQDGSISSCKHI